MIATLVGRNCRITWCITFALTPPQKMILTGIYLTMEGKKTSLSPVLRKLGIVKPKAVMPAAFSGRGL